MIQRFDNIGKYYYLKLQTSFLIYMNENPTEQSKKHETLYIRTRVNVTSELSKMKESTGEKLPNGKSTFVISEKLDRKDRDETNKYAVSLCIKHRHPEGTSVFQIIRYKTGEIKHVDCKTKNDYEKHNEWRYSDGVPIEEQFEYDDSKGYKIKCLRCGAHCDTSYEHCIVEDIPIPPRFYNKK
jgi:hypothetical protein